MKNTKTKQAVLTMGLPGAGKSYVLNNNYDMGQFTMIDPDMIKMEKEDYDPKNPGVHHEWSQLEAKARTARAIANGENIIIDGTGTNIERMVKRITELKSAGYQVTVLYVKVKLETSLKRNAERERNVPEAIIFEKYETITTAFEIISSYADVRVINND